jgi:hypothetical protein
LTKPLPELFTDDNYAPEASGTTRGRVRLDGSRSAINRTLSGGDVVAGRQRLGLHVPCVQDRRAVYGDLCGTRAHFVRTISELHDDHVE